MANVYFYSDLRQILGKDHIHIPAKSFPELFQKIFNYNRNLREKLFLENSPNKINPNYTLMLNDEPVDFQKVEKLKLKDTDAIHFIPPIVGG